MWVIAQAAVILIVANFIGQSHEGRSVMDRLEQRSFSSSIIFCRCERKIRHHVNGAYPSMPRLQSCFVLPKSQKVGCLSGKIWLRSFVINAPNSIQFICQVLRSSCFYPNFNFKLCACLDSSFSKWEIRVSGTHILSRNPRPSGYQ